MNHAGILAEQFGTTHWVITHQVKGLSQADSLLQPAPRGNCLNWVVGHVLESRNRIHALLGLEPAWESGLAERYARGSAPITGEDEGVQPLEDMMKALEGSQTLLMDALGKLGPADLDTADENGRTLSQKLGFLLFHEAYHSGQMEFLRQLSGVDDAVIS
jgi:hypothetical protein